MNLKNPKTLMALAVLAFAMPSLANNMNAGGQLGVARTTSTYTLGKGTFHTGLSIKGDYAYEDLRLLQSDSSISEESPFLLSQDVFLGYGITNWLDASLDLPVYQDMWDGHANNAGVGDLTFGLKMEHPGLYVEAPFRMAYLLKTILPTGSLENGYYQRHSYHMDGGVNREQAFSVGGIAFNPTMVWILDFGKFPGHTPLQLYGNLGGFIKIWDTGNTGRRSQTALLGNLAIEYQLTPRLGAFVELSGEARLAEFVKGYNFLTDLNNDVFRISAGPTLNFANGMRATLSIDVGISDDNYARTDWFKVDDGDTLRYSTTNTPTIGATLTLAYSKRGKDAGRSQGRFFAAVDTIRQVDTLQVLVRDTLKIIKNDTVIVVKNDTIKVVKTQDPKTIIEYGARVFPSINFYTGSALLTEASYPTLNDLAQSLVTFTTVKIEVRGFTDATGTDDRNKQLSQDRAQTVVDFLISKGVAANRLKAVGMGPANPIGDNSTVEGRVLNRRVEIKRID